jgi:hypothetical protein
VVGEGDPEVSRKKKYKKSDRFQGDSIQFWGGRESGAAVVSFLKGYGIRAKFFPAKDDRPDIVMAIPRLGSTYRIDIGDGVMVDTNKQLHVILKVEKDELEESGVSDPDIP